MYNIDWKKKARKQLDRIGDSDTRKEITAGVATLADWPRAKNVKVLTGHSFGYRLRVGRYRVLFNVADTVQIITIEEVKKRDDRTY